nr:cytochrome P450 89A2-like [Tanacetum cinerariifolium]
MHPYRIKSYSWARRWVLCNLIDKIQEHAAAADGIKVIDHFQHAMFSLLTCMCFGQKFDEGRINEIAKVHRDMQKVMGRFRLLAMFPRLRKILFRKSWKEYERVRVDLESVINEEDLKKMPYLKAVVLEGLRRHPPGHFVLPHSVTKEAEVQGYTIPQGATVTFLVAEMGLDPKVWDDPLKFKPERFLSNDGSSGEFDITGNKEIKMMPFGAGRRICPGYELALLYLEYIIANLMWYFHWTTPDGHHVDLSEKAEFVVTMKNPLIARGCLLSPSKTTAFRYGIFFRSSSFITDSRSTPFRGGGAMIQCREVVVVSVPALKNSPHKATISLKKVMGRFRLLAMFPRLRKILFRKSWKEYERVSLNNEQMFIPIIKSRIESPNFEKHNVAYVDTLVNIQLPQEEADNGNSGKLTFKDMVALCGEFFNAGTETTTTCLHWIMANLVKYPHIQSKLYDEIVAVVGPPPPPPRKGEHAAAADGIKVIDHFQHAMFSLLTCMCFGQKFDEGRINEIAKVHRDMQKVMGRFRLLAMFPRLRKILFRKSWKEYERVSLNNEQMFIPIIKSRIESPNFEKQNVAYVDTLVNIQLPQEEADNGNSGKLTFKDMVALCGEFFNAGTETTTTCLHWIMANLV